MFRGPLLALVLAACSHPGYRVGAELAAEGDVFGAMGAWLTAAEASEDEDAKLDRAIAGHAEDAWQEQLDVARDHEAAQRFADARRAYLELLAYGDRLARHDLLTWSTDPAKAELARVEDKLAAQHVRNGDTLAGSDDFPGAVVAYERAAALRPELAGLAAKRAAAYRGWAEQDLAAARYRDAVDHFDAAHALTGEERDFEWARSVRIALGAFYLRSGACRQAAADYEKALRERNDPEVRGPLDQALACARVELVVPPFEVATEDVEDQDLARTVTVEMEAALLAARSPYLALVDPGVAAAFKEGPGGQVVLGADAVARGSHLVGRAPAGQKAPLVAPMYVVRGKIDRVRRTDGTRASKANVVARRTVECRYEGATVDPDGRCSVAETLRFDDHRRTRTVTVSGSVRLLDARTGETVFLDTIEATADGEQRWVDGFEWAGLTGEWRPVEVATRPDRDVLAIPADLYAVVGSQAPEATAWPGIGEEAMHTFAKKVAARVVEAVDHGITVDDPSRLQVAEPLLDPSQIRLGTIEPDVKRPEDIEFAPPPTDE